MSEKYWNVVSLQGSPQDILSLRRRIITGSGQSASIFDFNVFCPVPSSLRNCLYSPTTFMSYYAYKVTLGDLKYDEYEYWGRYLYRLYLKEKDSLGYLVTDYLSYIRYCERFKRYGIRIDLGKKIFDNLSVHGVGTAVEWMRLNWGVLSNSYEPESISFSKFSFAVNGGVPDKLFMRLSQQFPDVLVTFRYAGDFPGHRCGIIQFLGGKVRKMDEFGEGTKHVQGNSPVPEKDYWKAVIGCRGIPFCPVMERK